MSAEVLSHIEVFLRQCRPSLFFRQKDLFHALIVGSDVVAYGGSRPDGRSWGAWAKQEVALDPRRTHYWGGLQTEAYHDVLACSDVHLYLTVPFVLSWSLLEAMAAGCALVCSATPPVEEVLDHGTSALLVDFFSSGSGRTPLPVCSIAGLAICFSCSCEAERVSVPKEKARKPG